MLFPVVMLTILVTSLTCTVQCTLYIIQMYVASCRGRTLEICVARLNYQHEASAECGTLFSLSTLDTIVVYICCHTTMRNQPLCRMDRRACAIGDSAERHVTRFRPMAYRRILVRQCLKPRLHQGNMLPGNMLRGRATCCRQQATCCLYLGNIIRLLFIYVTVDLYPFVSSNRRATNWQRFCCRQHVAWSSMLTWCKRSLILDAGLDS